MHAARRAAQRKARDEAIVTVAALTPPPENRKVEAVAGVRSRGATVSMRRILPCLLFATLLGRGSDAQEPGAGFSNTLGMTFAPVPGTTVLFAVNETRVSDYEAMLKSGRYEWAFKPHFEQGGDHPVVGINLQDALAFCNWLTQTERDQGKIKPNQGYRLPTNTEWSAAAGLSAERKEDVSTEERLQETIKFPWGAQWPPPTRAANLQEKEIDGYTDGFPFTAPVGSFRPSPEGLNDVSGNVWEWTWDRELRATPVGTLRGGSWAYFRRETLVSGYRYEVPVDLRAPTIGFRCVFEDKQRTAEMLAAVSAAEIKATEDKRAELMTTKSGDSRAVQDLLKATAVSAGGITLLDPATLKAATAGERFKNPLGMEFLPVAGLTSVLVGKTEVTLGAVNAWRQAAGKPPAEPTRFTSTPNHPAMSISWDDATAFCEWLTEQDRQNKLLPPGARYRLPTDAEWSTAAGLGSEAGTDPAARHLGNQTMYPWGTEWPPKPLSVNLDAPNIPGFQDSHSYTAPVGSMAADAQSLHDLGGNVSEWCQDEWPGAPGERVVRGGSWLMSSPATLLASARLHFARDFTRYDLGFRCVVELAP